MKCVQQLIIYSFTFLKYFPHTSFGSQNQLYISLNEVMKTIQKFNVTLHN